MRILHNQIINLYNITYSITPIGTLPIVLNSDVSPPGTHSVRVFTKSSASENVSYIISSTDRPTGKNVTYIFF